MSGPEPRVHLVTSAVVERTIARRGLAGVLSPAETAALADIPTERRRRDRLAGRVAAKRALRAMARQIAPEALPYHAIEIWNDADGAPHFTVSGNPELAKRLSLSIAHTDGAAVAGVADRDTSGDIGVDVEVTKPLALSLVRRVMGARERERLDVPGTCPAPLALWVAKEAAFKAARRGCAALRDVELEWGGSRPIAARVVAPDGRAEMPHEIIVRQRTVGAYTVAVALYR